MGKLVLYLPDGSLHDIPLDKDRLTIGRRPDNDVCLPYPAVSAEHAVVVNILADSFLEDLGSTNGTLVNGKAIGKHVLRDNDLIDIGRQRVVYFSDMNARADPLPPDMLRREVLGLHEQVERARSVREQQRKPAAAPAAGGKGDTPDPLLPDDELMAEILAAEARARGRVAESIESRAAEVVTGPDPATPANPAAELKSTAASRVAATWAEPEVGPSPIDAGTSVSAGGGMGWIPHSAKAGMGEGGRVAPAHSVPQAAPGPATPSAGSEDAATARYRVRVLSGASAGREVALERDDFSVGRVGSQVARLSKASGAWRLVAVEGAEGIAFNGAPLPGDGVALSPGDRFTVAGVDLAFERG